MTQLAINIRAFRKRNKITQDQLARHCKVSGAAVSQWESVKNPTLPDLHKAIAMADFFGTTAEHLTNAKDIEIGVEANYVLSHRVLANVFLSLFQNKKIKEPFLNGTLNTKIFFFNNLFGLFSNMKDNKTLNDSEIQEYLGIKGEDTKE